MTRFYGIPGVMAASLGLAMTLSGCAPLYAGKYDYNEGWREGRVTHVGLGERIEVHATHDCRHELSAERVEATRFARVTFSNARNTLSQIVPIAGSEAIALGDFVLVKMNDCSQPLVAQNPH